MSSRQTRRLERAHFDVQFVHDISKNQLYAAVNAVYGDISVVTCSVDRQVIRKFICPFSLPPRTGPFSGL